MKAVGFYRPSPVLSDSSFEELTLPNPSLRPSDLLIEVKATSINPVDYKERQKREASPAILGWDGAGRVVAVGSEASGFEVGDKVFWSGEFLRPGTNAELQTVNHALVGLMPGKLGFAEAASLPLTAITAYEALFERLQIPREGADGHNPKSGFVQWGLIKSLIGETSSTQAHEVDSQSSISFSRQRIRIPTTARFLTSSKWVAVSH